MKTSKLRPLLKGRFGYFFLVAVFFVGIFGLIYLLYIATMEIDYVWRWYRLPKYFANNDPIPIRADGIEGTVESISQEGKTAIVKIKIDGDIQTFEVPADDLRVSENDMISPGDVLSTKSEWRAGLMLQGMWITLKVSIYSILFGIIIGLIGGLARISSNPALKWWAITYVELIRGSPLLVQIFLWYFCIFLKLAIAFCHSWLDQESR